MDAYDEFKLRGLEEFKEFRYYKGENENPYTQTEDPIRFMWWNFEKNYFDNYKTASEWKSFEVFFDTWVKERAAPETGHDLKNGNPWKDEYVKNAPF